jgi:acyl-CoA dehydrogenase
VRIEANANLAGEPRDTLAFDRAPVVASAPSEVDGAALLRLGAFARAAQMAGALEFALAEAVRYASERVQFGRPIGKFQAIQQQMAGLAIEVAAAGAAAEVAAAALDRGDGTFEVAAAKVRVGEAAGRVAAIAHQVHGAIGFTQEHSLHFATRRLWAWRSEFGGIAHWAEAIGRQAAARGADRLWPYLASR